MGTLKITKQNFEKEVLKSDKPVLLDFWATWCGPCKMVAPIVDQVADEIKNAAKIGTVNIDEEPELAEVFNVMSIPTLVSLKDGKVVKSTVGVQNKETIMSMVQ